MNYRDLLAAAQANPATADFHALRMAYAHSGEYAPYIEDTEHVQQLEAALPAGDFEVALDAITHLLAFNYLDIEAHMAASYVYLNLEDHDRVVYHRAFARGLIDAILATGSGTAFDNALIVLCIAEEYTVLRVLSFVPAGQRLVEHNGHWFDILNVRQAQTGQGGEFYFNIDLPRNWLNHLQGDDHEL